MCPTRIQPKLEPIELDLSAAFCYEQGFGQAELLQLGSALEQARQAVLGTVPDEHGPIGDASLFLPRQMLREYHLHRGESLLGRILSEAQHLRDAVDRAVILGSPQLVAAAQALFTACGHPLHNELSRGGRGGRPRMYFMPAVPDNDALQALFDILPCGRLLHGAENRWGLLVLDHAMHGDEGASQLVAGMFSLLWDRLQATATAAEESELAVAVGAENSPLLALAQQIGIPQIEFPERSANIGSDFRPPTSDLRPSHSAFCFLPSAFLHPGVLLAASVAGIDIVKLLHGAASMTERFIAAAPGNNPALDFAGLCYLLMRRRDIRELYIESSALALQPLARHLQQQCRWETHGDSASRLLVQWRPATSRTDRLAIKMPSGRNIADRKTLSERLLVDLAVAQAETMVLTSSAAGQPTAIVRLPMLDESSIGQLIQLHAIANAVCLILNPEP